MPFRFFVFSPGHNAKRKTKQRNGTNKPPYYKDVVLFQIPYAVAEETKVAIIQRIIVKRRYLVTIGVSAFPIGAMARSKMPRSISF